MGLTIREFAGSITKDKGGPNEKPYPFNYMRICFPWSRTGKDTDGAEVEGGVPTLAEVMHYAQESDFPAEIPLDDKNQPTGPSVCQLLADGINQHFNRTASQAVQNTAESVADQAIALFMRKLSLTKEQAVEMLQSQLG
jgi:hypothetical protein